MMVNCINFILEYHVHKIFILEISKKSGNGQIYFLGVSVVNIFITTVIMAGRSALVGT